MALWVSTTPKGSQADVNSWLKQLAAPRWTVLFFLLTAIGALIVAQEIASATLLMALPFTLLALNLGAAVAVLPRFRRDLPLLSFHLALLTLLALFIWSRLTYLDATAAVSQGDSFSGHLITQTRGPLHNDRIRSLHFINEGFSERYSGRFRATYNQVSWQDAKGNWHRATIGGNTPLILNSYRIYTKRQRGYTPLFQWRAHSGEETLGRVQLNYAVDNEKPPVNNWTLPDGTEVWAMLDQSNDSPASFAPVTERKERVNMNAETLDHRLVLRIHQTRYSLKPGESVTLSNGTLTYLRLDAWLGYRIVNDPAQPWILATIGVGLISLFWFYLRKLNSRNGWDSDQ